MAAAAAQVPQQAPLNRLQFFQAATFKCARESNEDEIAMDALIGRVNAALALAHANEDAFDVSESLRILKDYQEQNKVMVDKNDGGEWIVYYIMN